MPIPSFSADDIRAVFLNLLPRGRVWPRGTSSVISQVAGALTAGVVRLTDRAGNLLNETRPDTTLELLPEWEKSLGLPDPCWGTSPTLDARRSQVLARFCDGGGQSVPRIIAYAASLGYTVTVTEYTASIAGIARAGDNLMSAAAAHTFTVNAALNTVRYFRAGVSTAGEPLSSFGNDTMICEINAMKPAHTVAVFAYT
ncbi:YmfQ family protein [Roseicella sp. DB1501]|uniref:YmfQ family protein n=1 Tax=Roseicella sp. DB1501 TaxID=2730925 RepID=UPI001490A1A2|nr:putative phage tail protein [Roseicella sp. DB1501]NOG69823.1 DUF2313 domain-containing protein [Roseicella sp. DB1501]